MKHELSARSSRRSKCVLPRPRAHQLRSRHRKLQEPSNQHRYRSQLALCRRLEPNTSPYSASPWADYCLHFPSNQTIYHGKIFRIMSTIQDGIKWYLTGDFTMYPFFGSELLISRISISLYLIQFKLNRPY